MSRGDTLRRALALTIAAVLLATGAPPVAAADAPGSCSPSLPSSPTGTWLSDAVSTPDDVAWFIGRVLNASLADAEASVLAPQERTTFDVTFLPAAWQRAAHPVNRDVRAAQAWRESVAPDATN
jgi:hypothetical protein